MLWLLLAILVVTAPVMPENAHAAARWHDAESWVTQELAPDVTDLLSTHPRFRGQSVRVVAFDGGRPAARTSRLAMTLRDRLASRLLSVPGVRLAADGTTGVTPDCTRDAVDYFVGLQVSRVGRNGVRLELRILDAHSESWVAGHAPRWPGELTAGQRADLESAVLDPNFRGARSAPFDAAEADVLARHVARELACASMRQLGGTYTVLLDPGPDDVLPGTNELIGNNLARLAPVRMTEDPAQANAVLRGKAHRIDGALVQFWVTLTPLDGASPLQTLTASAYVRMPAARNATSAAAAASPPPTSAPVAPLTRVEPSDNLPAPVALPAGAAALARAQIVGGRRHAACRGRGAPCAALQLQSDDTAALFVLNHRARHGLVRLSNGACTARAVPRVLHANESIDVAVPLASRTGTVMAPARAWTVRPTEDALYVLAISDSRAARAVARHLQGVPQQCASAARSGLTDAALREWLAGLASVLDRWREHIDVRTTYANATYRG